MQAPVFVCSSTVILFITMLQKYFLLKVCLIAGYSSIFAPQKKLIMSRKFKFINRKAFSVYGYNLCGAWYSWY